MQQTATKYYTFQVVLNRRAEGTDLNEWHEYKDCDDARIKELRAQVWTIGVRIQTSPTAWEIVSPFMIKQVFILLQDKKHSP